MRGSAFPLRSAREIQRFLLCQEKLILSMLDRSIFLGQVQNFDNGSGFSTTGRSQTMALFWAKAKATPSKQARVDFHSEASPNGMLLLQE